MSEQIKRAESHDVFAVYVDDWDDAKLRLAAKQVAETMASPGWAVISELAQVREDRALRDVIYRSLDHAAYESETGLVAGLRIAREAGQTVLYVAQRREREIEAAAGAAEEE